MNEMPTLAPPPHRVALIEDRWATIRHAVEAIAIVLAGVWSFYVFEYEDRWKPAHTAPTAVTTVHMESLGVRGDVEYVRVTRSVRNTGSTEIDVIADLFQVGGSRPLSKARRTRSESAEGIEIRSDVPMSMPQPLLYLMDLRKGAGGDQSVSETLNAGESSDESELIAVPRGRFTTLHAKIEVLLQRADAHVTNVSRELGTSGHLVLSNPDPSAIDDSTESDFVLAP